MNKTIVVIGTGLAGYLFAKEFRKCDQNTQLILITQDDGAFYSKPLLSTALTNQKTPDQLVIQTVDVMRVQLNATILTHSTVVSVDATHKEIIYRDNANEEKTVAYDELILANGAKKSVVSLEGDAIRDVISVNNLMDYRYFHAALTNKKRVVILGTGLVGCEFANDLSNAGFHVAMISPDAYPLNALVPEEIGFALQIGLTQSGVDFHLGVFPKTIDKKNNKYEITLSSGESIATDLIFSAVGIKPDISLAKSAGLKTNLGVLVDAYYQTSNPHIFALGDCIEYEGELRLFIAAILHGAPLLAKKITGHPIESTSPPMSIIVKTPACPIVIVKPKNNIQGFWKITCDDEDKKNVCALFYDDHQQLRGFVLSGASTKQRIGWLKQFAA